MSGFGRAGRGAPTSMVQADWRRRMPLAILSLAFALGASLEGQSPSPEPSPPIAPTLRSVATASPPGTQPTLPAEDPVLSLIAASESHFKAGERELAQGHLEAAKIEFDRAVDVLLESPYGGGGAGPPPPPPPPPPGA